MSSTVGGRPTFSAQAIVNILKTSYGIEGVATPLPAELDQNFKVDAGETGLFVVKIANRERTEETLDFQNRAMDLAARTWKTGTGPEVVKSQSGDSICTAKDDHGTSFQLRVLTYMQGTPLAEAQPLSAVHLEQIGNSLGELNVCLKPLAHPAMKREMRWDLRQTEWLAAETLHIADHNRRRLVQRMLVQTRGRMLLLGDSLPMSVIHNDAHDENILLNISDDGALRISGLLDWGDIVWTHTVNELAAACPYAVFGHADPLESMTRMVSGYHLARALSFKELQALFPLICRRLCLSVTASAIAMKEDPDNAHRQASDRPAWKLLEKLELIDWNFAEEQFRKACRVPKDTQTAGRTTGRTYDELIKERAARVGPSVGLVYNRPLEIVRGRGQFLFDANGRAYLDCVNNICHVGHSHPRVVSAMAEQALTLNTNTRYLHSNIVEYARRLTDTLPESLSVCYFVNSGSEANELAIRLARAHTDRKDVIVLDHAYHGNTSTMVDISPYKCEGPGGAGLPDWVHKVPIPDPYRGIHRDSGPESGTAYARHVDLLCAELVNRGHGPGLFICEPIMGCGGQVVLPGGFLREAFAYVRAAGGVCAVDEVQTGMGRVGTHWWSFQAQDAVPDIVTMGKPMGNGHPLGAVVTTKEIATSFANGMEYFSSFGGNPVSAAVGLAVLDVIEGEQLRQRAARVGKYLTDGFKELENRHSIIGDVRGQGMFMGVELVQDRDSIKPATELMARLVEELKSDGVLISAEGPHHNVLKIKPPLQFVEADADLLLATLNRAMGKESL